MTPQRAAEIQTVLEGVALPAAKAALIAYARAEDPAAAGELEAIPDREYRSIDEVGEELVRVQPWPVEQRVKVPRPESGKPPGGEDYTNPRPESGAVRPDPPPANPPQKALEKQTQLPAEQQAKQDAARS